MTKNKIAVIGLGYVGLPLARLFATKYPVIGFDIDKKRINQLQLGLDTTLEVSKEDMEQVLCSDNNMEKGLFCTNNIEDIEDSNIYIITVPTPVDDTNRPDLTMLRKASLMISNVLKKDDIVIYESTVYPGATEEDCVPFLEKDSGLKFNKDFFVGYSPERINPGDKERTVENILKVTSGSTKEIGLKIDKLYGSVIKAGTYLAPSIKVAEASKVIENSQRDINIAFVNELAKIFSLMDIDTHEVLEAAGTKWNFLPFKPGLVGGHCIGVDPFYLAMKAQKVGYHPELIFAGRRINDGMGRFVAGEVIKLMLKNDIHVKASKVLILGITFKENCPDIRNTKVVDLISHLQDYGVDLQVYDPWVNSEEVKTTFGLETLHKMPNTKYDAIVLAVNHKEFESIDFESISSDNCVIYDVKGTLDRTIAKRL